MYRLPEAIPGPSQGLNHPISPDSSDGSVGFELPTSHSVCSEQSSLHSVHDAPTDCDPELHPLTVTVTSHTLPEDQGIARSSLADERRSPLACRSSRKRRRSRIEGLSMAHEVNALTSIFRSTIRVSGSAYPTASNDENTLWKRRKRARKAKSITRDTSAVDNLEPLTIFVGAPLVLPQQRLSLGRNLDRRARRRRRPWGADVRRRGGMRDHCPSPRSKSCSPDTQRPRKGFFQTIETSVLRATDRDTCSARTEPSDLRTEVHTADTLSWANR